jgi:predicted class III extradiol MEMO1 family dioxygenase
VYIDGLYINAIKISSYKSFLDILDEIKNIVYRRQSISIVMAAIEVLKKEDKVKKEKKKFKFIRYKQSSDYNNIKDSSINYYSAFTIF